MMASDKERAKQVIAEIIRQAGGELDNKTNLFKAFWLSHVHAIRDAGKALSNWPIVRMPRGPGIHRFDVLLGEMLADGLIVTETIDVGSCQAFRFKLVNSDNVINEPQLVEIIRHATSAVQDMTATRASEWSHEKSRSWQNSADGDELDIVLDSMTDDEVQKRAAASRQLRSKLDAIRA